MRKRDGGDDRDQKNHRRDLERESVVGVDLPSQRAGIAVTGPGLAGTRGRARRQVPADQHQRHLDKNQQADGRADRDVTSKSLAHLVEINVQHHHHEQKQHHHRADVNQHQRDGQELRVQQHPHAGGAEKRQHQPQSRMDRIAAGDHAQRREHEDRGEGVENDGLGGHR